MSSLEYTSIVKNHPVDKKECDAKDDQNMDVKKKDKKRHPKDTKPTVGKRT